MSTIKFVPMEFFAQFALTQMRRLQARGAVGAALGVRGGVGGRRSLFVRLSRRGVPIVNAGRCRRGFPGAGTSLADVESCWWAWGRCLRAWGAVGGRGGAACGRGALSAGAGTLLAGVGRCRRARVAVCAAFSGARERRPVLRTPPPFRAAHGACRSACPLAARPHPPVVVRASPPARWPHAPRPSAAPRAAPPLDIPPQRCYYNIAFRGGMAVRGASDWVWRSLVACLNGVQEAGGSNPLTQTTASEQSPLCSGVFFAFGRCICRKKAAAAPLPCSSFSAKGHARLACSLASALTTARCRYQPFAAAAPCGAGDGAGACTPHRKNAPPVETMWRAPV